MVAKMSSFLNHLWHRCKQNPESLGVIDHENELYTRLMYNLCGQLVGYQRYNWKATKEKKNQETGRYYTYFTKGFKSISISLMGFEHLKYGETLYLVEGMFEQATANAYGVNCLAVLSNNPQHLKNWLYTYPGKIIALCQNDPAGKVLQKMADSAIMLPQDVDELSKQELLNLIGE